MATLTLPQPDQPKGQQAAKFLAPFGGRHAIRVQRIHGTAKPVEQPHGSQAFGSGDAHMAYNAPPLEGCDFPVQRLDSAVDFGHAAVIHGLAVIADDTERTDATPRGGNITQE